MAQGLSEWDWEYLRNIEVFKELIVWVSKITETDDVLYVTIQLKGRHATLRFNKETELEL